MPKKGEGQRVELNKRNGSLITERKKQEIVADRIQIRIQVISLVNCARGEILPHYRNPCRKKESLPYKLVRGVFKAQNYCPRTNKFPKQIQKIVEPIL